MPTDWIWLEAREWEDGGYEIVLPQEIVHAEGVLTIKVDGVVIEVIPTVPGIYRGMVVTAYAAGNGWTRRDKGGGMHFVQDHGQATLIDLMPQD